MKTGYKFTWFFLALWIILAWPNLYPKLTHPIFNLCQSINLTSTVTIVITLLCFLWGIFTPDKVQFTRIINTEYPAKTWAEMEEEYRNHIKK